MNENRNQINQEVSNDIQNEFPRVLDVKTLGSLPAHIVFTAREEEKINLAKRLQLVLMKNFEIKCHIQGRVGYYPIEVSAFISADIVQSCVITLQDVHTTVRETVFLKLFPYGTNLQLIPETFEENEGEAIALSREGTIDLGEILVQYLSLSIDLYPKIKIEDAS